MNLNILLVMADLELSESICVYLTDRGMRLDYTDNGLDGAALAHDNDYDLLLIDLRLPKLDGLGLCQQLRCDQLTTPVILLSDIRVNAFCADSDDYLMKPFQLQELHSRILSLATWHNRQQHQLQQEGLLADLAKLTTYHHITDVLQPEMATTE